MKKIFFNLRLYFAAIILFASINGSMAQSLAFNGGGAWQSGVGGILTSNIGIQNLYNNPAGLTSVTGQWGIDIGLERRFNLSVLSTVSAGAYYNKNNSVFGLSLVRFGYSDYAEQKINLSYGRKLWDRFSLGGNFTYIQYRLNEFGNKGLISFDIGLRADITKSLSISTLINNPASLRFDENTDIPVRLAIGTNYHPSKKVDWLTEVEKIIDNDITVKSAIVYKPLDQITISIGGDLTRNFLGFGVGYNLNGFKINGAYSVNQILGNYPAVSLSYEK